MKAIELKIADDDYRKLADLAALAERNAGGDRRGNVAIIFALSLPVIVMLDKKIQSGYQTVDDFGLDKLPPIDRGKIWDGKGDNYLRYQFTDDGISPRSIPGMEGGIFWTTTDEHDQRGHITESAENRVTIMNKRMGKFALALKEIPSSRKIAKFGPADAETTIVCWGTATGSARATGATAEK